MRGLLSRARRTGRGLRGLFATGMLATACQAAPPVESEATARVPVSATVSRTPWVESGNPTVTARTRVKVAFFAAATDLEGMTEVGRAVQASNDQALARLRAEGRAFDVAQDERVEILQREGRSVRVRMTSGPNTGREGWLPAAVLY